LPRAPAITLSSSSIAAETFLSVQQPLLLGLMDIASIAGGATQDPARIVRDRGIRLADAQVRGLRKTVSDHGGNALDPPGAVASGDKADKEKTTIRRVEGISRLDLVHQRLRSRSNGNTIVSPSRLRAMSRLCLDQIICCRLGLFLGASVTVQPSRADLWVSTFKHWRQIMYAQSYRPVLSAALPFLGSGVALVAMLVIGAVSVAGTMMGSMAGL
jgi:hypothetical protein